MLVQEIMTRDVECVRVEDTVARAAERMRELDVGALPVCDHAGRLLGILTDRDIAIRSAAAGADADLAYVGDVMSPGLVFCREHDELEKAAALMGERQLRRLAVLNDQDQLVGIVSLGDVAVKADGAVTTEEILEDVSQPAEPKR